MKNKGFTIVELMAVIVILGILSSMAMISVSRYRKDVRDTDLVELHQTIDAAYDKYRQDNLVKGASYQKNLTFEGMDKDTFNTYFSEFTFDGKRLTKNELKESVLNLVSKGGLLLSNNYKTSVNNNEDKYVEDGACLVESTVTKIEGTSQIKKSCKEDSNGSIMPSQEEILCIVIKRGDDTIIDDYSNDKNLTQRPLCKYLTGTITQGNN